MQLCSVDDEPGISTVHISIPFQSNRNNCIIQVTTQDDPSRAQTFECFTSVMVSSVDAGRGSTAGAVALEKRLCPTLGTGWYHVVTTRILMSAVATDWNSDSKTDAQYDEGSLSAGLVRAQRYCTIAKSPMCELRTIPYLIGPKGIMDTI